LLIVDFGFWILDFGFWIFDGILGGRFDTSKIKNQQS
jgi:hypothetical protein